MSSLFAELFFHLHRLRLREMLVLQELVEGLNMFAI